MSSDVVLLLLLLLLLYYVGWNAGVSSKSMLCWLQRISTIQNILN